MLMLADREEISRGLAEGLPYREIGLRLGRDSSVISREVGRYGGRERYRAAAADTAACAGRERPKLFAVERSPRLRAVVCQQLRDGWSPASIAGRLPTEYAADESCRVSHEAVYQCRVACSQAHPASPVTAEQPSSVAPTAPSSCGTSATPPTLAKWADWGHPTGADTEVVALNANASLAAAGGDDQTVRLFDLRERHGLDRPAVVLTGPRAGV